METFKLVEKNDSVTKFHAFINVIKHFKHLNGSYFAIILQEGLKNCQREDASMEKAYQVITSIMDGYSDDFQDLIQGIENGEIGMSNFEISRSLEGAMC